MDKVIGSIVALLAVAVVFFIISAQFLNIYKFAVADFEAPYKTEIIRGVSIAIPVVAIIIGYMDIGEENTEKVIITLDE